MKVKKIEILGTLGIVNYAYGINKEQFGKINNVNMNGLQGITICNPKSSAGIYIIDFTPETISHEAFHAVFHTANNFGIKLSKDSEEWFAHSIDKIVSTIYKIGDKNGNK